MAVSALSHRPLCRSALRAISEFAWSIRVRGGLCGALGNQCALVAIASLLACGAGAQSAPRQPAAATPVGVWRGTSVCLVRPSACKDEVIVFRIAQAKAADSVTLDGRKVVGGVEEEMGILACRFTAKDGQLTCALPQGTWQFRVRDDSLVGALRMADSTKVRDVRTTRAR